MENGTPVTSNRPLGLRVRNTISIEGDSTDSGGGRGIHGEKLPWSETLGQVQNDIRKRLRVELHCKWCKSNRKKCQIFAYRTYILMNIE